MRFFVFLLFVVCAGAPGWAAMLHGYGDVDGCYKFPDESIPTCDGSAYRDTWDGLNYCYVPSMKCNVPVLVEGFASYQQLEFSILYATITPIDLAEYNGHRGPYIYCRMTQPYQGLYVGQAEYPGVMPAQELTACYQLYYDANSYNCYQNPAHADETCWDDFAFPAFWDADTQEAFLSSLFATEMPRENPCDIGISRLMVSTGASFQLYAEPYTEPSMVIQYNGGQCYGKLGVGLGVGTINIKTSDGTIYHMTE